VLRVSSLEHGLRSREDFRIEIIYDTRRGAIVKMSSRLIREYEIATFAHRGIALPDPPTVRLGGDIEEAILAM
jgi:hypothetical protein